MNTKSAKSKTPSTKIIIEGEFSPKQAAMALASFAAHPLFSDFNTSARIKAPKGKIKARGEYEPSPLLTPDQFLEGLEKHLAGILRQAASPAVPPGIDYHLSMGRPSKERPMVVNLSMSVSGKTYIVGSVYQMPMDRDDGWENAAPVLWGYGVDCNDHGGDCISSAEDAIEMLYQDIAGEFFEECVKYVRLNTITSRKVRPVMTGKEKGKVRK